MTLMLAVIQACVLSAVLFIQTSNVDAACSPACTLCSGSTCLQCEKPYFLYEGWCFYRCPKYCDKCNSRYVCDVCEDDFYRYKFIRNGRIYVQCRPCIGVSRNCSSRCEIEYCHDCETLDNNEMECNKCWDGYPYDAGLCLHDEAL